MIITLILPAISLYARQSSGTMATRKSYTIEFKKQVLATLSENEGNVSKTAQTHKISRMCVIRWRQQKDEILYLASPKTAKRARSDSDSGGEGPSFRMSPGSVRSRKRRRIR